MRSLFITLAFLAVCLACKAESDIRSWTSKKSGKTIQAKLIKDDGSRVTLIQENNNKMMISRSALSVSDLEYLDKIQKEANMKNVEARLAKAGLKRGQQEVDLPESLRDSKILGPKYYLFIPKDYGSSKDGSPLVMFLHGAGERGENIQQVGKHGVPKIAKKKKDFPFIAVSPQCQKDRWWHPDDLKKLLDHVVSILDADESRLYLTGLSMGGFGSWAFSAAYPDTFAAVVPICGGGNPNNAEKLKDLPLWVFHGDNDNVVNIDKSRVMVDALKKLGSDVKFTVYPGVGHDSWTKTYDNPEVFKWLLDHKK